MIRHIVELRRMRSALALLCNNLCCLTARQGKSASVDVSACSRNQVIHNSGLLHVRKSCIRLRGINYTRLPYGLQQSWRTAASRFGRCPESVIRQHFQRMTGASDYQLPDVREPQHLIRLCTSHQAVQNGRFLSSFVAIREGTILPVRFAVAAFEM